MRKIFNFLRSKFFLYSLMIILQFALIAIFVYIFNESSVYFYYSTLVIAVITVIYIVNTNMIPEYKIAWITPILIFPIFGVPLYFMLGKKRFGKRKAKEYDKAYQDVKNLLIQDEVVINKIKKEDKFFSQVADYVYNICNTKISYGDYIEYFKVGEEYFDSLVKNLKEAKEYIFLEYFILKEGYMWDSILEVLKQKVKEGVEVRFLYDDVGSMFDIKENYYKELSLMGIKTLAFSPYRPFIDVQMNNRNHRKICVIDGKVAFTGGINIADEYINRVDRFGHWKDTGVLIKGKGVYNYILTFIQTWNMQAKSNDKILEYNKYFYNIDNYVDNNNSTAYSIFFSDTPKDDENLMENIFLNIIDNAKSYVYINTPYLIIDSILFNSLVKAAKSGVDVRIAIPGTPDKKTIFMLTKAFAHELVKEKVKIYSYNKGFLHAKSFVSDDIYSIVGTANLDYRSLYLHFECGTLIRDKKLANELKKDYLDTLNDCQELSSDMLKANVFVRIARALLRLFAPLL